MHQLNYRKGSLADLRELKELGLKAYGQFQQVLTPDNWEKFRAGLADENKLVELISISTVFICETDKKKIIGMAILVPSGHPMSFFLAMALPNSLPGFASIMQDRPTKNIFPCILRNS
jgi:hypothetical protein